MKPPKEVRKENERVAMMSVARDVVGMLFHRDHPAPEGYAAPEKRTLTQNEGALYDAAMRFLTKEFNIGHCGGSSVPDEDMPEDPTSKGPVKEPVTP